MTNSINQNIAVNTQTTEKETTMNTQNQNVANEFNFEVEENLMNNNIDLFDFSNLYASKLTSETTSSYEEKIAGIMAKELAAKNSRLRRVGGLVQAVHIIKQLGVESLIGKQLLPLAVSMISSWHFNVKGSKPLVTHVTRYHNEVKEAFGKESLQVKLFEEAIKFLTPYKTNESIMTYQSNSPVKVEIKYTGIRISIDAGATIEPKRGQKFCFNRRVSMIVNHHVLNQYLETVLKSIRIHNIYTSTQDLMGNTKKVFTKETYAFNPEDVLGMLLLMKLNNIDLTVLFDSAKSNTNKLLILQRANGYDAKTLSPLEVPTFHFFEKYNNFSVASTKDAKNGVIMPLVSIPRLIEFNKHENGDDVVFTRELVNKTLSRLDKLNNAKILWSFPLQVFIAKDVTHTKYVNQALVGGSMLVPDHIIESEGQCRVVTDMDHGGIKSSIMGYSQTVGNVFHNMKDKQFGIVSAAGFKGGLLSAASLVAGAPDKLKNMNLLVSTSGESDRVMDHLRHVVDSMLQTIQVGDEIIEGVFVTLDIGVTNSYSVDDMMVVTEEEDETPEAQAETIKRYLETLTEELDSGDRKGSGLRAYVAKQKNENPLFSVSEWVQEGLESKTLKYKPAVTRVIYQELQSVAAWHGKDVALNWLKDLMQSQIENDVDINKLYAVQYIGGVERTINRRVDLCDIADTLHSALKGANFTVEKESPLYPLEVVQEVLDLLEVTEGSVGWVQVVYPDNSTVDLPLGRLFTVDLYEQIKADKNLVVTKGLLNSLLEHVKVLTKDDGSIHSSIDNKHLFLDADVQRALLGKVFGYQSTKGFYGAILPMVGDFGVSCAGIVHRNRLEKSDSTWLSMTLSKAPQYFKGSTATYNVYDMNFGYTTNCVSRCVVFVNPEIALMFQNDFDGDMMRVSVGSSLPFVSELYDEFNGTWFKTFVDGEFSGNKLNIKAAEEINLLQYHEAIYNSVIAKDNVGLYTASSYFYEGVLPNLINNIFIGVDGKEYTLTNQDVYKITAIMKMLIQIEAMNNMKQESGNNRESVFITDIILPWKLGNIKSFDFYKTDEQVIVERLEWIETLLESFSNTHDVELTKSEIKVFVQAMYCAAKNFKASNLKAMNVFNARSVSEKYNSQIMLAVSGEEFSNAFSFKDSYDEIVNGIDTASMAYSLILSTVDMVSVATFRG